jgi:hypothetical protein
LSLTAKLLCLVILLPAVSLVSSCVSFKLKPEELSKSKRVTYAPPSTPFKQFFPEHLDMAWQDPTGRSISFLSECGADERISLEDIHLGLARTIDDSRLISKSSLSVAGQEALRSVVEGHVNQQASVIDLVVLQDESCTYILNYVAAKADYLSGVPFFENFMQNFRVHK